MVAQVAEQAAVQVPPPAVALMAQVGEEVAVQVVVQVAELVAEQVTEQVAAFVAQLIHHPRP